MSLTSYRAAPPRVNFGPPSDGLAFRSGFGLESARPRKGGTYSRFEEDVKRDLGAFRDLKARRASAPYMGILLGFVKLKPSQAPPRRPPKDAEGRRRATAWDMGPCRAADPCRAAKSCDLRTGPGQPSQACIRGPRRR